MSLLFALLTGLGVGSGGLYILYLIFSEKLAQAEAQGLNLLFFSLCILCASLVNFRFGRIVASAIVPILFFGLLTTVPAAILARHTDAEVLSRLFGAFLVFAGLVGLLGGRK